MCAEWCEVCAGVRDALGGFETRPYRRVWVAGFGGSGGFYGFWMDVPSRERLAFAGMACGGAG